MNATATDAQIDAAWIYERLFVPAEFQEWAGRVAAAVQIERGQRVLDVACGTGVLARAAAARTGDDALISGVDADIGMLTVAQRLNPGIDYRHSPAEALPYPDHTFDVAVSQFGLMFFQDRVRALREMHRVLRPGGRMGVAVWDTLENTPAYCALVSLLERVAGQSAADALRAPFCLGDRERLASLFVEAGIQNAEIHTHTGVSVFPSVRTMVEADLRGWLPVMGVTLTEAQIEMILKEAEQTLVPWRTEQGQAKFDSPAHIVTAKRSSRL